MMEWFGPERPRLTYGRLAYIHCDGQPAIELLEIVAPEPEPGKVAVNTLRPMRKDVVEN